MNIRIETPRFFLRPLTPADASDRYLGWLRDPTTQRFIAAAAATAELAALRGYIAEKTGQADTLFLGIFDKSNGQHVGNVKYEPVDVGKGETVMGILIGDPAWRGKGVATEVLKASANWLQQFKGIRCIKLGVDRENEAAITAYRKTGFVVETRASQQLDPTGTYLTMVLELGPGDWALKA